VIPCGDMHQSFADTLVDCKVVFRQLPTFADSLVLFLFTALPEE